MDARLQLRVQRYGWDAAAPHYQDGWSAQLRPAQETLLSMAGLQPGMRVLETACGTGLVTFRAAHAVAPDGSVLATDLSAGMIREITRRAEQSGILNVEFARMGAEELDAQDSSFDASICALGLMYVPDPRRALSEMARVTRPGGKVTATIWGERRNCGWAEIFPIVDARVASQVCPMFFAAGPPGIFQADFASAGLVDIQETRQSARLFFKDQDSLADAVIQGGPVAMAIKRFSQDVLDEVRREFLASASESQNPDGSYSIQGEFVTVVGTVPD